MEGGGGTGFSREDGFQPDSIANLIFDVDNVFSLLLLAQWMLGIDGTTWPGSRSRSAEAQEDQNLDPEEFPLCPTFYKYQLSAPPCRAWQIVLWVQR